MMCLEPAAASGCEPVYRLYRTSVPGTGRPGRIHVATFDSCEQGAEVPDPITGIVVYNEGNCEIARNLFQKPAGRSRNLLVRALESGGMKSGAAAAMLTRGGMSTLP